MTKNPLYNALAALAYISLVASFMFYGSQMAGPAHSILGPIAVISMFTLSAAVMGYVFCYQPIVLFLDNHKKQAIDLFLKTTLTFGIITLTLTLLLFSGLLS